MASNRLSSLTVWTLATLGLLGAPGLNAQVVDTVRLSGPTFRTIGPATMSGRVVDLAVVESDPQRFYLASATGGVWKTTDNGINFEPVFESEPVHSVGAIAVHPVDTSVVWVGTGERASRQSSSWGDGVYRSTDGGESWTHVGLSESKHIGRITLHPTDPDIAFVAAMGHLWGPNEERGLYRTLDGGASWTRVIEVDEDTGVVDVAMDPSDPSILYASSYQRRRRPYGFHGGGMGSGLWKSTDGGSTWTSLTNQGLANGLPSGEIGRIGISIYRSDPRIVYISVEQGERYNASTAYLQRGAGVYRSEDRGESWELMSDWNPRPMYASQILVDPSDDQRIYMVNSYSFSDDGGRTFRTPPQSLHGDDRLVWVNPEDSRHVMKADDGGLGISYDRGLTWLYSTHLPLSQFYRVGLDNAVPFNVCGGLQDNGSWCGPSATYRSEGILNEDWVKWGGGDGFKNVVDTTNNRILYTESQYLGLSRVDMVTGQRKTIRPNQPESFIGGRRNWTTWPDLGDPEQRLGNAMPPGNWDGPFTLSPHDPNTIYAGLDELFVSNNQGDEWRSLGDRTTGVDRRTLLVMGELPDSFTLSLDDGIPYYPTVAEIAESPVQRGLLWVGTDDGNVQVSQDGGGSWDNVADRVPGLPSDVWVNGLEPSRVVAGRVYLAANNYRNDDYANYLYRSDDFGQTWVDLAANLPPERVVRTVREDPRNPAVLWLGTELGLFWSHDMGLSWNEVRSGLPTLAVNDLQIHPRDNDLVLGTHGRGVWILDNINAFQELNAQILASESALFSLEPAYQIRYRSERGHTGDMIFEGSNPDSGALIDYWLGEDSGDVSLNVFAADGRRIASVPASGDPGLNRATWNLREHVGDDQDVRRQPQGPLVVPGTYTVQLSADGVQHDQTVEVREDPRLDLNPTVRTNWTTTLREIYELGISAGSSTQRLAAVSREIQDGSRNVDSADAAKAEDLLREFGELSSRIGRLRGSAEGLVGPLSVDEQALRDFAEELLPVLNRELDALLSRIGGH